MNGSNSPVIERNGIAKALAKMTFGKRAKNNAGKEFYGPVLSNPEVKELTLADGTTVKALVNIDDLLWAGIDDLLQIDNKSLRQIFAGIFTDNIKSDGTLDEANWRADATDFSGGVDRLSDIKDELDDLQTEQGKLLETLELSEEGVPVTKEAIDIWNKMKENKSKINTLKQRASEISSKYAERAEKRKATEAANEAAAAAAKAA